jgi:hypothetical protein
MASRRTPSLLSPSQAPSSPNTFLSLVKALRRSFRARRSSLFGQKSSASSLLERFLPSVAR